MVAGAPGSDSRRLFVVGSRTRGKRVEKFLERRIFRRRREIDGRQETDRLFDVIADEVLERASHRPARHHEIGYPPRGHVGDDVAYQSLFSEAVAGPEREDPLAGILEQRGEIAAAAADGGRVGIRRGQTPSRREIMAFLVRNKSSYFRFR